MVDIYTIFNLFYSLAGEKILVIDFNDSIYIEPRERYKDQFQIVVDKRAKKIELYFYKHNKLEDVEVLSCIGLIKEIPLNRHNFNKLRELIEQNYELEWSYTDFLGVTRYYYKRVKL